MWCKEPPQTHQTSDQSWFETLVVKLRPLIALVAAEQSSQQQPRAEAPQHTHTHTHLPGFFRFGGPGDSAVRWLMV